MSVAITVYTKPGCQPCKATIRKLDKLGAEYDTVDLAEHPEAIDTIKALGYLEAPVVVVGDEHWSGYKPHHIEQAVKRGSEES